MHRVDDWRALDPWRFFTLVDQLAAYPGALRSRLQREAQARAAEPSQSDAETALAELVAAGVVSWER